MVFINEEQSLYDEELDGQHNGVRNAKDYADCDGLMMKSFFVHQNVLLTIFVKCILVERLVNQNGVWNVNMHY